MRIKTNHESGEVLFFFSRLYCSFQCIVLCCVVEYSMCCVVPRRALHLLEHSMIIHSSNGRKAKSVSTLQLSYTAQYTVYGIQCTVQGALTQQTRVVSWHVMSSDVISCDVVWCDLMQWWVVLCCMWCTVDNLKNSQWVFFPHLHFRRLIHVVIPVVTVILIVIIVIIIVVTVVRTLNIIIIVTIILVSLIRIIVPVTVIANAIVHNKTNNSILRLQSRPSCWLRLESRTITKQQISP